MHYKDILIALCTIFIWSVSLIIQKIFCQQIALEFFNLLRFASCIPLLMFFKKPAVSLLTLLIVAFFWNVLNFFFIGLSLTAGTGVGTLSVVYQTCSFFGVFFCFVIHKEVPKIYQLAGMVLAFSGVILLFKDSFHYDRNLLGLAFALFAAMSWGLGIALIKKYKLTATVSTNIWLASISSLPMLAITYLAGGQSLFQSSLSAISFEMFMGIIFTAFIAILLAGSIWFYLIKKYTASATTSFMLLLPVFSCILSYTLLGERFTALQISAFFIIVLGVAINQNIVRINLVSLSSRSS